MLAVVEGDRDRYDCGMQRVIVVAVSGLVSVTAGGIALAACSNFSSSDTPAPPDASPDVMVDSAAPEASMGVDAAPQPPVGHDCSPDPSRFDVPGNGIDEDCDGKADDEDLLCDGPLVIASTDAFDAAKAMGLCTKVAAGGTAWGVVDAHYALPDGTVPPTVAEFSSGLLPAFGVNAAHAGQRVLALSSGKARAPDQAPYEAPVPGYVKGYMHGRPTGFSTSVAACGGVSLSTPHDGYALVLRIQVPSNANSFSFYHQYFTADYGDYVCSPFSDVYGVVLAPAFGGAADGNIVRDSANDGVVTAASTGLLRACTPGMHGGLNFTCPLGTASLAGTGFEAYGATGWLKTTAPVKGGTEITLTFAIWDSGDGMNDSTALFDDFTFSTATASAVTTVPAQ